MLEYNAGSVATAPGSGCHSKMPQFWLYVFAVAYGNEPKRVTPRWPLKSVTPVHIGSAPVRARVAPAVSPGIWCA